MDRLERRTQTILDSLNAACGTAFDASNTKTQIYVENMATARELSRAWGTNQRVSYLWQPYRCSMDILARWERILVLSPLPTDTDLARRRRVAELLARFGQPCNIGELEALLTEALGSAFVSVDQIKQTIAVINVPDGTYPWGTVGAHPWSSTVSKLLVRLEFSANLTPAQCLDIVGQMYTVLDPVLPAHVTIDWYANGAVNYPVTDGPSGAGFILDQAHNLDAAIFDV